MKATKLTSQIQKELRKINPEVRVEIDTEFAYLYDANIITYCPFQLYPEQEEAFADFVEKTFDFDLRPHSFLFALLHEVGHSMTMDSLEDDELTSELIMREAVHLMDSEKGNDLYFNLPSEKMANKWAVDYFKTNFDKCIKLENKMQKMLNHYYKKIQG